MRLSTTIFTAILILISAGAVAENFNRPPYFYPAPGAGYPPYYPASQRSTSPVQLPQSTTSKMAASPVQEVIVEPDTPATDIAPETLEITPPQIAAPITSAVDGGQDATEQQAEGSLPPVQSPSLEQPVQDKFNSPPQLDGGTQSPPHIAAEERAANHVDKPVTATIEQPVAETSEDTSKPPAATPVTESKAESVISTQQPAAKPAPSPVVIELSLAEKLSHSQPLIESAIRNGNFAEAYYLWRPLAEAGDASAQYGIGWMYHNGYGLSIDDRKAYEWWSRAAAQNYVEALFSIGTLYQFGYGVMDKDIKTALGYYLMAAVAEHEESRLILKTMLDRGDSTIKPILPALLRFYLYSAITGDPESGTILENMLLKRDPRLAPIQSRLMNHYLAATIAGDQTSGAILKQMVQTGDSRISEIMARLLTHYRDSAISGDKESQQILRTLMLKGDPHAEGIVAELLQSHPKVLGNIPATVRVKRANTRMGPGTEHKVIKVVKQGDELMVIDRQDGWLLTQLADSDRRVWISAKLVNLNP